MQSGSRAVVLTAAPQAWEELHGETAQRALQGSLWAHVEGERMVGASEEELVPPDGAKPGYLTRPSITPP